MKKIWLCGASGMLGSHFKHLLTQRNMAHIANGRKEIDITDLHAVSEFVRMQKITHIINCAAYTQVDQAEIEQKQAYMANAMGPYHLGIAGRRHGVKVVHFSSDYVFDGKKVSPYTEEYLCTPIGAYGMSKLAGEIKLMDEHRHACIIRTSWLFGNGKNFVDAILRLMQEKDHLRIVSDQVGRPTYSQDLAEITLDLLDQEGIYHFANAGETSWFQFAKEIHKQATELGYPSKVKKIESISSKEYPSQAPRPSYSTLNTKKIEHQLGKTPRSWQAALADYLNLKKNPKLQESKT